eukprot:3639798-Pyramimonas_sp.AAC.1
MHKRHAVNAVAIWAQTTSQLGARGCMSDAASSDPEVLQPVGGGLSDDEVLQGPLTAKRRRRTAAAADRETDRGATFCAAIVGDRGVDLPERWRLKLAEHLAGRGVQVPADDGPMLLGIAIMHWQLVPASFDVGPLDVMMQWKKARRYGD